MMANQTPSSQLQGPALYMLWPIERSLPDVPPLPDGYKICTIASDQVEKARPFIQLVGDISDSQWRRYCDLVVPDGLFVVTHAASSGYVGSIGAMHNPAATRFYFPGGGELAYLMVAANHRQRGLGTALVSTAVRRLLQGGYRHIFLGVQPWRLPAIQAYLRVGFQPFIHATELAERWRLVFAALGREIEEAAWPNKLP